MPHSLRSIRHDVGFVALHGLLTVGRILPLKALRQLGAGLGRLALVIAGRECARAKAHLHNAFPELNSDQLTQQTRAFGRHLGLVLGEVIWLWSASEKAVLEKTEFIGLDNLTRNLNPKRGVVMITAHCGNWEWLGLALAAAGLPMTAAARAAFDPRVNDFILRFRGRFGTPTVLRGDGAGTSLVRALRNGRVIGVLIDQDIDAPGVFVDFFGHPAWTPTGAVILGLRTKMPIVTALSSRQPDGRFRMEFAPVDPGDDAVDLDEKVGRLTALVTKRIESHIRRYPDQWVWNHQRWRRQPGLDDHVFRHSRDLD